MTSFSGNGGTASYYYNASGLRVMKAVYNGAVTISIYSGSSVIAEYNNNAPAGSPLREYIYNPAGGATTGLLAMLEGGAVTYYHQDHLSARLATDANGAIVSQEGHYPYGEPWYSAGPGNKWMFTSYQRDSESGLDYAVARYYDARTGTFCSADPLAGSPGDPQSWNRYPYGRNNPIMVTDPSGKSWFTSMWASLADAALFVAAPFTMGATLAGPDNLALVEVSDQLRDDKSGRYVAPNDLVNLLPELLEKVRRP
jgi:RHS repeat-associated protein